MNQKLHSIVYISRASEKFERLTLVDLCARAAANNKSLDVTGLLLCMGNTFLQVLEGSDPVIHQLYKKIYKDTRHTQCRVLFDGSIPERAFGLWSMNFLQMDDEYFLRLEDFNELRNYIERSLKSPDIHSENILKILQKVPKLLKAHKVNLDILSPVTLARGKV